MPSSYAHYRFGTQVLDLMPADIREPILRNRALFDAGLQGPDFLFFHSCRSNQLSVQVLLPERAEIAVLLLGLLPSEITAVHSFHLPGLPYSCRQMPS